MKKTHGIIKKWLEGAKIEELHIFYFRSMVLTRLPTTA